MIKINKILLFFFIYFFAFKTFAIPTFDEIQKEFNQHIKNYNYENAYELKDTYLTLAKEKYNLNKDSEFNRADIFSAMLDIVKLYEVLEENENAVELLNEYLRLVKKFSSTIKDENLNEWSNLENDYKEAYAFGYEKLCRQYNGLNDLKKIVEVCEKSISLYEEIYSDKGFQLIAPLTLIGEGLQTHAKYYESIEYFERAFSILLNYPDADNNNHANLYYLLALSFSWIGSLEEAENLYFKALEIYEQDEIENQNILSRTYSSLSVLYAHKKNFDLFEVFHQKSLKLRKKIYGTNHIEIIRSQTNFAYILSVNNNNHTKCIEILKEILEPAIQEYGLYKFEIQNIYSGLSLCEKRLQNFEKSYEYALEANHIAKKIFDPLDLLIADSYNQLSELNIDLENFNLVLEFALKSAEIQQKRNLSNFILLDQYKNIEGSGSRGSSGEEYIYDYILKLSVLKSRKKEEFSNIKYDKAFNLIQSISDIQAAKALHKSSIRIFNQNTKLNTIIKNLQDLELEKIDLRKQILNNFLEDRDINLNLNLEKKLNFVGNEINKQNDQLKNKFPDYFNLILPHNSTIAEIQEIISSNEILLSFFIDERTGFIFTIIISDNIFDILIAEYEYEELLNDINSLRVSLDSFTIKDFDYKISYKIYNKIIEPIENYINNKEQLLIVPDKALFKIPFSILVQETYEGPYKNAPWLINDYSIVNLPSINSLKYLHDKDEIKSEKLSYIGFGDPILSNYSDNSYRGIFDNIDEITKLDSLPETKDELLGIAEILGNENGNIYLGKDATETKFKELEFENINLLLFATHGLVSGELKGLDEPGLVMTPPPQASIEDNGILSASEILSFNFPSLDLVILSACNTSAGTSKNPEELSGLTRSFFYAGANSLLVSHWPVESESAVKLTTNMFKYIKENNLSKGYALQNSMKDFIQNADKDYLAHPIFWAPFMLVGGN